MIRRDFFLLLLVAVLVTACGSDDPGVPGETDPVDERELERSAHDLIRRGRYEEALGVLTPLPRRIRDEGDRRQLALAGTILLHLENNLGAQGLLRRALAGVEKMDPPPAWSGPAYANFGRACLLIDKYDDAVKAYRLAAAVLAHHGRTVEAGECQGLAERLKAQIPPKP